MRTLVIGDAITDEYVFCNGERPSPEDPTIKVYEQSHTSISLGGALNAAANIASLTNNFCYFSGILSRFLGTMAKSSSVYAVPYLTFFSEHDLIKQRLVDKNHQQVCRIDYNKDFGEFLGKEYCKVLTKNFSLAADYSCIVLSDYCKGTITNNLIKLFSNYEKPVFVDTKNPELSLWKNIPKVLVKLNEKEDALARNKECVNRIVTRGCKSALFYKKGESKPSLEIESQPVVKANVIGAGDVYLAGLVGNFIRTKKYDIAEMMRYAELCARVSVKKFGTGLVSLDDLRQEKPHLFLPARKNKS